MAGKTQNSSDLSKQTFQIQIPSHNITLPQREICKKKSALINNSQHSCFAVSKMSQ